MFPVPLRLLTVGCAAIVFGIALPTMAYASHRCLGQILGYLAAYKSEIPSPIIRMGPDGPADYEILLDHRELRQDLGGGMRDAWHEKLPKKPDGSPDASSAFTDMDWSVGDMVPPPGKPALPRQPAKDLFGGISWNIYEKTYPPHLVEIVKKVDRALSPLRIAKVQVWADGHTSTPSGIMRVFDGSNLPAAKGAADTPMERIFRERGVELPEIATLRNEHRFLFEIGKFNVMRDLDEGARVQTRVTLETWLLERFVKRYDDDAAYVLHTASPLLRAHFEKEYGFKVLREIRVNGAATPEFVMSVSGAELGGRLEKRVRSYQPAPTGSGWLGL